jgi:dynein heavy chain
MKRESKADTPEDWILLRALIDCNLPKFLADDVPLFEGIISDLFPGVSNANSNDPELEKAIIEACKHFGVQPVPVFIRKCFQLYDTTRVRHGLMLVGPTGGGKTTCCRVLGRAMTTLTESGKSSRSYEKVAIQALNPKSITM